jgi:hypothetical protein
MVSPDNEYFLYRGVTLVKTLYLDQDEAKRLDAELSRKNSPLYLIGFFDY